MNKQTHLGELDWSQHELLWFSVGGLLSVASLFNVLYWSQRENEHFMNNSIHLGTIIVIFRVVFCLTFILCS